ncbi:MAG: YihA family ribosome biogenesis GTP-binding protein, partial [Oscillospiraceae bacterium]|nr:YihA family ribosome biogenesis GTP-binding protein [Oscillospiraceae bacterium]
LAMINLLIDAEIPFILVFTKSDKLNKTQRQERMAAFAQEIPCFEDIHKISFSIKSSEGLEDLQELLAEIVEEEA